MRLRLLRHDRVDSTSERAFAALAAGTARHGDLFVARSQSAGRGRRGRTWHSPEGEGLYASLVLLPGPPPLSPVALTFAGGLAMLDAARALFRAAERRDPGLRLVWPNDLVAGEAKLAGVLVETRGLDPQSPHYVVGLGLDVRQTSFPPELLAERRVTSLALLGVELEVETALEALLAPLAARFEAVRRDPARLAHDWLEATGLAGARVEVEHEGRSSRATLDALDQEELRLVSGSERIAIPLERVQGLRRL